MKASHVHVQHVPEFDFLPRQPIHPTAHLGETLGHLHKYKAHTSIHSMAHHEYAAAATATIAVAS